MNARLRMLLVGMVGVAGSVAVWAQAAQTSGRDADAAAIRAHIESIFAAFIDKDAAKLAATHGRDTQQPRDNYALPGHQILSTLLE